jgi:probable rRNA maturation factor
MSRPNRKPAPIAVVWQATDPAPPGWTAWLKRLLSGYAAALGHPGAALTLLVADDEVLRDLNAAHRGLRRVTDILSFADHATPPRWDRGARASRPAARQGTAPKRPARAPAGTSLGELAVSLERVRAQARANGWDGRTELARLLAHGCVHLLGYDHATRAADARMLRIEERLLAAAGFAGLYPRAQARVARRRPPAS